MITKQEIKKAKKIIRFRNMPNWAYNVDKFCKIRKLKIKNMNIIEEAEAYTMYRVKYKMGSNLFNPLTWIIFIIPTLLIDMVESLKDLWEATKPDSYTTTLKIKKNRVG